MFRTGWGFSFNILVNLSVFFVQTNNTNRTEFFFFFSVAENKKVIKMEVHFTCYVKLIQTQDFIQ